MPYDSPLPGGHTPGSDEGRLKHDELMELVTKLSDRVVAMEEDLKQTKKTYSTALTKLVLKVKKLEKQVRSGKARRRARIVLSEDEDAAEDPSKQGRKIAQIDTDPTISLVQDEGTSWFQEDVETRLLTNTFVITIKPLHSVLKSLNKDFGDFVRNFNMHCVGKTVSDLHALLIDYEKGLKDKAPTPQQNPPQKKENPKKDQACHYCNVVGHWKRNCPLYLEELRTNKNKKAEHGAAASESLTRLPQRTFPSDLSLGIIAGERIPYEASTANIPQRLVARERLKCSPGKKAIVVVIMIGDMKEVYAASHVGENKLTAWAAAKVEERIRKSYSLSVHEMNSTTYQVGVAEINYIVDMGRHACTCRKRQLSGLPCNHVIAVLTKNGYIDVGV
ncbi:zinc finger, CCHC-type containing protein [Tanacetum coccineum]